VHQVKIVVKIPMETLPHQALKIQRGIEGRKMDQIKRHQSYYDKQEFHPGFVNIFEDEMYHFKAEVLYDSLLCSFNKICQFIKLFSDIHVIASGLIPVHDYFIL